MRRPLLVNGSILALALGTLAVVWATRDAPTTNQLAARQGKLVPIWNRAAVERISLRRGAERVVLERDASLGVEGDFKILEPWPERADIATVSALLGSLELASPLRSADGVDRAQAGLTSPALEIALKVAENQQVLRLGGPAPAPAGARYLEVVIAGEARIYTISAGLVSELDVPLDKVREPRLFELTRDEISRIEIGKDRDKISLTTGKPFYLERSTGRELARRETVTRLLTALSRLVVSSFVAPEQARTLLQNTPDAVRLRIEPTAKSTQIQAFTLGGTCPHDPSLRLALREVPQLPAKAGCVAADIVEGARIGEADLALDTPFAASFDEVESIVISSPPHRLDLRRKDTAFVLAFPGNAPVSLEAGNDRIQAIVRAAATRPQPPPAEGQWQGDGWISIDLAGGAGSERITLGRPRADGSRCLRRELDQVVLCVNADNARALTPDGALLRGSTVTSFAAVDVKDFSIEVGARRERIERQRDGNLKLLEPQGFTHDGSLVTDVIQLLGSLRAERWVATVAEPTHGLDKPRLRARVTLTDPDIVHELIVGAPTTGGYFARLSEDPQVFVLAGSALETLEIPLIDRNLSPFEITEVVRIELQNGNRKLDLRRQGDDFQTEGLAAERTATLVETLKSLRAEQALHVGAERANEGLRPATLTITFTTKSGEQRALRIGARDRAAGLGIAYARLDGVDATFALAESTVTALRDF